MIKLILSTVFLLVSSIFLNRIEPVHNGKEENFKKSVQYLVSEQLAAKETVLLFSKNKRNSIARFVVFTNYKTAGTFIFTTDYQKLIFRKE
jgi:hypothetical protein